MAIVSKSEIEPRPDISLTLADMQEIDKCIRDPLYLFNKYIKYPYKQDVTQVQYEVTVNKYQVKKLNASISAMGSEVSVFTDFN